MVSKGIGAASGAVLMPAVGLEVPLATLRRAVGDSHIDEDAIPYKRFAELLDPLGTHGSADRTAFCHAIRAAIRCPYWCSYKSALHCAH